MIAFEVKAQIPVCHDDGIYRWNENDQKNNAYLFKVTNKILRFAYRNLGRQIRAKFGLITEITLEELSDTTFTIQGKIIPKSTVNQMSLVTGVEEVVCDSLRVIYSVPEIFGMILDIDKFNPHIVSLVQPGLTHDNPYIEVEDEYLIGVANLIRATTGNSVRPFEIRIPGQEWTIIDATAVAPNPISYIDNSQQHTIYGEILGIDNEDFHIKFLQHHNQYETQRFFAYWENDSELGLQLLSAFVKKSVIKIYGHNEVKMIAGESNPVSFWIRSMEIVEEGLGINLNEDEQ